MKTVHVRNYTRNAPKRPIEWYWTTARLQRDHLETVLAKKLERELSNLTRADLERIRETY